jgi:hypothetical protein
LFLLIFLNVSVAALDLAFMAVSRGDFVYISLHSYILSCTENISNWITRDSVIEENKAEIVTVHN